VQVTSTHTERRSRLGRRILELVNKKGPLTSSERSRLEELSDEVDSLEQKFQSKLDFPLCYGRIWCRNGGTDASKSAGKQGCIGLIEVHKVEQVKSFNAELKPDILRDRSCFEQRQTDIFESRPSECSLPESSRAKFCRAEILGIGIATEHRRTVSVSCDVIREPLSGIRSRGSSGRIGQEVRAVCALKGPESRITSGNDD